MGVGADSAIALGLKPAWNAKMMRPERQDAPVVSTAWEHADDRELVTAFRAGRREAFDEIVVRHRRNVYQLCYRFVGNQEDASDLAQDVFVRAFKGLARFKGDAALGTWLYRVGVNVCLNRLALKRPPVEPIEAAQRVDGNARDPLELAERSERSVALKQAIAKLPPKQRATVVLRVYQELSHEEIARVLNTSVGAAKANFFHAIGNLKRLVTT